MKNLKLALFSFCALSLNCINASAPGGPAFDHEAAAVSKSSTYFPDHDYLKGTPTEMLPGIVQELHTSLTNAIKHMDRIAKNDALLFDVSPQSTNANTVNCMLVKRGITGFDQVCQSIHGKLEALKAKTTSALELAELQKEIEQAASVVSKVLGDSKDGKSK